ncbi:MAG: stage II sporulation protein M [Firmicutes bacterium]|nr:stage II sporulation protein M [Candidatus Fermentithermobacillaceae bacterium]
MTFRVSSPLVLSLAFFILGAVLGAVAVKALDPMEKAELLSYVQVFLTTLNNPGIDSLSVLKIALLQNLKTALLVWALGLTIIGIPIACALVFVRGFALAFSASFLVSEGPRGPLLVLLGLVPHNLLAVPALIFMVSYAVSFSFALIRERAYLAPAQLWNQVFKYTAYWARLCGLFLLAAVLEAHLSPLLIGLLS